MNFGEGVDQLKRHFPELESLRGVLALLVLQLHTVDSLTALTPPLYYSVAEGAMDFFFCLSGFLITRNFVLRYSGQITSKYFLNRTLRIWPMYFMAWPFAVFVTAAYGAWLHHGTWEPLGTGSPAGRVLPAFFLQNVDMYVRSYTIEYTQLFMHSWSVAIEEQFYLLAPFVLVLLLRETTRSVLVITAWSIALFIIFKCLGIHHWTLVGRMSGFALGAALAVLELRSAQGDPSAARFLEKPVFALAFCAGVFMVSPFLTGSVTDWTGQGGRLLTASIFNPFAGFSLIAFALIGLIATGRVSGVPNRVLNSRFLQYVGRRSYSLYLFHVPIVYAIAPALLDSLGVNVSWNVLAAPIGSLACGMILYTLIEAPFLRLKAY